MSNGAGCFRVKEIKRRLGRFLIRILIMKKIILLLILLSLTPLISDSHAQVRPGSINFMAFGPDAVKGVMTISSGGRVAASWSAPHSSQKVANGSINLRTGRGFVRRVDGERKTYDLALRTQTKNFTSGTADLRGYPARWTFWATP